LVCRGRRKSTLHRQGGAQAPPGEHAVVPRLHHLPPSTLRNGTDPALPSAGLRVVSRARLPTRLTRAAQALHGDHAVVPRLRRLLLITLHRSTDPTQPPRVVFRTRLPTRPSLTAQAPGEHAVVPQLRRLLLITLHRSTDPTPPPRVVFRARLPTRLSQAAQAPGEHAVVPQLRRPLLSTLRDGTNRTQPRTGLLVALGSSVESTRMRTAQAHNVSRAICRSRQLQTAVFFHDAQ